jgi:hypothetical protein
MPSPPTSRKRGVRAWAACRESPARPALTRRAAAREQPNGAAKDAELRAAMAGS